MKTSFLIVVDMQNDFITDSLGTKEAQGIVPHVVNRIQQAKEKDEKIIFTQDTHSNEYLMTHEGKNLPVPHCLKSTEGWKLHPDVWAAASGCVITMLEKPAFGSLDLLKCLSNYTGEQGVDDKDLNMELVGLCTDICVVSNALMLRSAFPEAEISVRASCCAGVTPQKHEAALEVMRSCQIHVIEGDEE